MLQIKDAIVTSKAFSKKIPGGPYAHYTLCIPLFWQVDVLDWLLSGQAGESARSLAFTEGLSGFPKLFGFPVALVTDGGAISLVPNELTTNANKELADTLETIVQGLRTGTTSVTSAHVHHDVRVVPWFADDAERFATGDVRIHVVVRNEVVAAEAKEKGASLVARNPDHAKYVNHDAPGALYYTRSGMDTLLKDPFSTGAAAVLLRDKGPDDISLGERERFRIAFYNVFSALSERTVDEMKTLRTPQDGFVPQFADYEACGPARPL